MATGDFTPFDEYLAYSDDGDWASTDDIKCAILDNTTTPAAGDVAPALGGYTEVGTGGNYTAGGTSLGTLTSMVTESGGIMKFDSATAPTWAANAGNDTDAWWGLVYNDTQAGDPAIGFVELGGPRDMSTDPLTLTPPAGGIYTKTVV